MSNRNPSPEPRNPDVAPAEKARFGSPAEEQANNPSEIWAVLRSVTLVVGAVLVVGWIIG